MVLQIIVKARLIVDGFLECMVLIFYQQKNLDFPQLLQLWQNSPLIYMLPLIFFILINFWFGFGFGFIKCFYNFINFIALLWCDCALGQFVQWYNLV